MNDEQPNDSRPDKDRVEKMLAALITARPWEEIHNCDDADRLAAVALKLCQATDRLGLPESTHTLAMKAGIIHAHKSIEMHEQMARHSREALANAQQFTRAMQGGDLDG